jgi:microcystin degradation protein MlrC
VRIAIAGFLHESNTFNPIAADRAAFASQGLAFGADLVQEWADAHHEVGGFLEAAGHEGFEPVPLLMAWATPAGPVSDAAFEEIAEALLEGLRRERCDGLLLALHGAMVTRSILDADAELLARIRAVVGPDLPIAVTLDLHGNIPQRLIDQTTLTVAYRTNPHLDQRECGRRAARLLVRTLRGEIQPVQALARPPLLIPILAQDTSCEPLAGFMARARALEEQPGILAVSLLPGFAWADVPHLGTSVIVVADGDRDLAERTAYRLANDLYQAREAFVIAAPEAPEAVRQALQASAIPVVLVDTGDNVGGGSAGDGTVLLAELLRQKASGAVVCLFAPEEVKVCQQAGVGATVQLRVGGKVDRLHGEPVAVTGVVRRLHDGTYVEPAARHGGKRINHMGPTALVELPDDNLLVLTTFRHPPFSLGALTCLGIEPRQRRILVVKGAIAWKAAYGPVAGTVIPVETPGSSTLQLGKLGYRHLTRPLYPLDLG